MQKISFLQKWYSQREKNEEGQSLVIIAFVLIGILAFVGIAVDVGFVFARGSQLQAAVDAAALAGVTELIVNKEAADTKAGQFLNANNVPITGTQRTATFLSSEDVTELGANEYTVTVTWPVELFFLRVLGFNEVDLTRAATAASFSLTDIYASRRVEEGTVGTSTQGIFGPHICTSFGDPFSPWSSTFIPGPYAYRYRILIPPDFVATEDVLRVEIFDPDTHNSESNSADIIHTQVAQDAGLPANDNKACGSDPGRSYQTNRWNPCLLRTEELTLYEDGDYELDTINPFWFVRVDENRGAGAPPGNLTCPGNMTAYEPGYNTETQFRLFYYRQSADGNPVPEPLAQYTGRPDDSHLTDLRWVSPGAKVAAGDTFVPADPSPGGDFELDLDTELPNILVEPGTGSRYIYLEVEGIRGASENSFEIWAGPDDYVEESPVPSNVNERNLHVRNNPGSHNSRGVTVYALGNLPMNAVYGNCDGSADCDNEVDRPVDIPLIYVGPEYAGSTILVSLFDSDSGARSPIIFYFDSLGFTADDADPKGYDEAETDWAMAFAVDGQADPDGQVRTCVPGSCNNQWVTPAYNIQVPGNVDNCDWSNTDWVYQRDNCTPFYGGRLVARYIGGESDTYGWQIRLTGLPYLVR